MSFDLSTTEPLSDADAGTPDAPSAPLVGRRIDVTLEGSFKAVRARELLDQALAWDGDPAADGRDLVIDCALLEGLDASAVQILLALRRSLSTKGRELVLRHLPAHVETTLRLAGLADELLS